MELVLATDAMFVVDSGGFRHCRNLEKSVLALKQMEVCWGADSVLGR